MPQLDAYGIVNQIFWSYNLLYILYTHVYHEFIPLYYSSMMLRLDLADSYDDDAFVLLGLILSSFALWFSQFEKLLDYAAYLVDFTFYEYTTFTDFAIGSFACELADGFFEEYQPKVSDVS
jgi:hypothetical protein